MKTYCKYHPLAPAHWHCNHCFGHFCRGCVPNAGSRQAANCPSCQKPLRYLGGSNLAEPFWRRISTFFRYPLAKDPILLILLCTALPLLFQNLIMSLVLTIGLAAIQMRYLYGIIEQTADGKMTPPTLGTAFQGGGLSLLIQQLLVFISMVALEVFALHKGGALFGIIMLAFLVLIFPASVMLLALEKRAVDALNPIRLMGIIGAIGWPYFVLYGYLVLMFLSLGVAQEFIVLHIPETFAFPLLGLTSSYFLIVIFHMLGYLLFQYQYQLGYSADLAEETPLAANTEHGAQVQAAVDIDISLKDGQYGRAVELMVQEMRRRPQDYAMLERLYQLLWALRDWGRLRDMVHPMLRMLLAQNRQEDAVRLIGKLYDEADFELADPLLRFNVAQVAHMIGEHRLVLRLLKDLHKDVPDFEFLPDAYVLMAKTLANALKDRTKALSYLKFVQQRFPDHAIQARLADYFESLRTKGLIL